MRFLTQRKVAPGLWRRVPPAIFPPILGGLGLILTLRLGVLVFFLPEAIAEGLAGAMALLTVFALMAYGAKLLRRPGVLIDELRILPGRAGIAAMILCLYLWAGVIAPYAMGLAKSVLVFGMIAHLAVLAVLLHVYRLVPAGQRRVSPVWHLNWVGFIVAAPVAAGIGWTALATVIFWPSMVAAIVIWAISARQLQRAAPPAPLRPLLAIHIAPAALLGTVATALQIDGPAAILPWLALGGLLILAIRARWLLAAGFSPIWGALTFPLAAVAGCWMLRAAVSGGAVDRLIAAILLVAAALIIPPILFLILRDWARGRLAIKTNAAIA